VPKTGPALGDSQALDPPLERHALGRAPGLTYIGTGSHVKAVRVGQLRVSG